MELISDLLQIEWAKTAADLQEQATGRESSLTQVYRFALAQMLYHAGDYPQSLSHFRTVYESCKQLLGNHNHLTLTSLFAYGMLLWINGDVPNAEKNIAACLEESKQYLWSVEQQARAQFYFSKLLRLCGKVDEAVRFERMAGETKDELVAKYPNFLNKGPKEGNNEDAVFDLMVPIGRMRFAGGLHGRREIDWY